MNKDEKSIGERFCDALYETLAYSCKRVLDDDLSFGEDELYMYSEVFEHFELIMLKLQPFKSLMDMYENLSPDLVGFAITKDVNDFEVGLLDDEVLQSLKKKIDDELDKRKSSSAGVTTVVQCDSCGLLRYNGICNYCALTMECYDSRDDLIDGILPNCPKKESEK